MDLVKLSTLSTLVKSILDILKLRISDLPKGSLKVEKAEVYARGKRGNFRLESCWMKTPQLSLVCRGDILIPRDKVDVDLFLRPFPTLGKVIGGIPILGKVLVGDSGSIEIGFAKIKGSLRKPKVKPTISKSLGKGIINILKRALELPTGR